MAGRIRRFGVRPGAALLAAVVAAVMAATSGLWPSRGAAPVEREFIITAHQFAYDPPRIRVNVGDRVTLRVRSADVAHGLYLDPYGINVKVPPLEERVIQFVADRPGKLRYRCSVICGSLHPFMVGEIVVEPNRPLAGALGLAAAIGFGSLAYAWRRKGE